MIKFLMLMVTLVVAMPLVADTQSDWYASLSSKHEATSVRVGDDYWNASDANKPLPYRFKCGAVLHSTAGGKRLDLNNTIVEGGIYAYGDISIFLTGNSISFGGIRSDGSMLIYGYGSVLVSRLDKPGSYDSLYYGGVKAGGSLSVFMGASVTVKEPAGTGLFGSDSVVISASTVGVHGAEGRGIYSYNRVEILGAAVAISSYCDGIEAQGGGGVVIDGSVVNVFARDDGIEGYAGINITHSYAAIVSIVNDVICYPLCAVMSNNAEVRLDNSIVKLLSRRYSTINTYKVTFGEGDYYVATDSPYSGAISVDDLYVSGGNVRLCASGEDSRGVNAWHFQIDSGSLEVVDKIDVREFLKFDAAAAALYTGVIADGTIDVSSFMANFYSQVILDAISNAKIGNLNGVPNVGIDCSGSSDTYTQNGGTVWCGLPKYGVMCDKPVVNGGSYKGQFYNPSYSRTISGGHDPISPVNSSGNALKCVSYAVAGAKKYDKITQSWSGILPSYYGTGSLYTDAAGKLYFWVPESWTVPGGGSGGSGGGDAPAPTTYWTVTFNANGGSVAEATRQVANGTAIGALPTPTKSGYVFLGWYTAVSGGSEIVETSKITAAVTCFARWDNEHPDLRFVTPSASAWEAPMFISVATGDHRLIDTVVEGQTIYLSYAFQNYSTKSVSGFKNVFRLSNGVSFRQDWLTHELKSLKNGGLEMVVAEWLQNLKPGKYTLTCTLNDERTLTESDYSNNTYTISFTVVSRNSVEYDLGFASWDGYKPWSTPLFLSATYSGDEAITSFAQGDTVYIRCGCKNLASNFDMTGFKIVVRLNNGIAFTNYYYMTSILNGGGVGVPQYWHPKELSSLSPGTYTMTVTLDAGNAIMETDESNNSRSLTFTVVRQSTLGKVEGAAPSAAASEYNGMLVDAEGALAGTIQVKVGNPGKKDGKASVSATVVLANGQKKTLKAADKGKVSIAADGPTEITFSGGAACEVVIGSVGMSGHYGSYEISGARDLFSSKDKAEANAASDAAKAWIGSLAVVWDGGTASITIDKKGKAKASVVLSDGTKGSATSQLLFGEEWDCVPVMVTKKMNVSFALWLPVAGGTPLVTGLGDDVVVGRTGSLKAGARFRIDMDDPLWTKVSPDVLVEYLPCDVPVVQSGTKWTLPKAGKISVKKGVLDDSKAGENPSGLKLSLKKDGTFSGSFKVYYIEKGKLKSGSANVTGLVIDGVGYGTATIKKVGNTQISIE